MLSRLLFYSLDRKPLYSSCICTVQRRQLLSLLTPAARYRRVRVIRTQWNKGSIASPSQLRSALNCVVYRFEKNIQRSSFNTVAATFFQLFFSLGWIERISHKGFWSGVWALNIELTTEHNKCESLKLIYIHDNVLYSLS